MSLCMLLFPARPTYNGQAARGWCCTVASVIACSVSRHLPLLTVHQARRHFHTRAQARQCMSCVGQSNQKVMHIAWPRAVYVTGCTASGGCLAGLSFLGPAGRFLLRCSQRPAWLAEPCACQRGCRPAACSDLYAPPGGLCSFLVCLHGLCRPCSCMHSVCEVWQNWVSRGMCPVMSVCHVQLGCIFFDKRCTWMFASVLCTSPGHAMRCVLSRHCRELRPAMCVQPWSQTFVSSHTQSMSSGCFS